MNTINRHTGVPLYLQVADLLEREIRAGAHTPEHRLPPEAELASRYEINRLTVRQGLSELAHRGLVRTVHGRGTFPIAEIVRYDISGDREASLSRTMREQGRHVADVLLDSRRDDQREAQRELLTRGAVRRFTRLRLVDGTPWMLTWTWLPERRFSRLEELWSADASLYDLLERHFGVSMRRSYRTIWTEVAAASDSEHLDVPRGAPLLVTHGLNVSADGEPVAISDSRARGDRAKYTMRFR
jgi:GntR family phosphonate transport system transcriptional regulator